MIKLLFMLTKLWFKLVFMLVGVLACGLGGILAGMVAGETLTRAGLLTADQGQLTVKTKADSSGPGGEHGRTES
jgi:hypothetical protein